MDRRLNRILALAPGPIVAAFQLWRNLFDLAWISNPDWPAKVGVFSVAVGSLTILPVVALWDRMSAINKRRYLNYSLWLFAAPLIACYFCHFLFATLHMPSALVFNIVFYAWGFCFIIFGVFIAHILTGFVLYREK